MKQKEFIIHFTFGMLSIFSLFIVATTCDSARKTHPVASPTIRDRLDTMTALYSREMKTDIYGFILTDECDSLLFTSLANPTADLSAAEIEPGRYLRRPIAYSDCFSNKLSRSDVSIDMLIGVMYASYLTNDIERLLRLWNYGSTHAWIMAQHGGKHAIMRPGEIALLAQLIYVMSEGEHDFIIRHSQVSLVYNEAGYVQHLQAITYWLTTQVYDHTYSSDFELMGRYAKENPKNPIFLVMIGGFEEAASLILNTWPENRLPSTLDWCEEWRIQRVDTDVGLLPCPNTEEEHSGGEILFLLRHLKGDAK